MVVAAFCEPVDKVWLFVAVDAVTVDEAVTSVDGGVITLVEVADAPVELAFAG